MHGSIVGTWNRGCRDLYVSEYIYQRICGNIGPDAGNRSDGYYVGEWKSGNRGCSDGSIFFGTFPVSARNSERDQQYFPGNGGRACDRDGLYRNRCALCNHHGYCQYHIYGQQIWRESCESQGTSDYNTGIAGLYQRF